MHRNYRFIRDEKNEIWADIFEADAAVDGKKYPINPRCDLYNHSPDGFEWGYAGSGPAQAALAVLADFLSEKGNMPPKLYYLVMEAPLDRTSGDQLALVLHQRFKHDVITPMSRSQVVIQLDQSVIENWLNRQAPAT